MLIPQNGMMADPIGEWLKQGYKIQTFRPVGLISSHSLAIFTLPLDSKGGRTPNPLDTWPNIGLGRKAAWAVSGAA